MNAGEAAELLEVAFATLMGVYFLLRGYRVIGPRPGADAKADAMHAKWGRLFRILGIILTACGSLLVVIKLLQ